MGPDNSTAEHSAKTARQLLLLGAGHAHIHVLSTLAAHPLPGVQVSLVAPYPRQMYSGMVPGFVAGRYTLDECVIALEPLLRGSGVRWLQQHVSGLDARQQTVQLDDGSTLHYDSLSIDPGPLQNRALLESKLPGARAHGLFLRPSESFAALWPQVAAMADARPLRFTVIGGDTTGAEVAMALRQRFAASSVTLLSGAQGLAVGLPASFQARLLAALKTRRITVLPDHAAVLQPGEVTLGSGAGLACDVPLICTGPHAAPWLAQSGLALDDAGFVATDRSLRCSSHPEVFSAGPYNHHRTLAHNLRAAVQGTPLRSTPPGSGLQLLSCGDHGALALWGHRSAQGRWVGWLQNWIDRRMLAGFRTGPTRY